MNILFTPPFDQKILSGQKTMTARCWKQKPPRVGQIIDAQTGYANSTRFAKLKVVDVWEWDGSMTSECLTDEIAKKEGFEDANDFIFAYYSLNSHTIADNDRRHWFIEFEVVNPDSCSPLTRGARGVV